VKGQSLFKLASPEDSVERERPIRCEFGQDGAPSLVTAAVADALPLHRADVRSRQ
jgi:hypothetical protein